MAALRAQARWVLHSSSLTLGVGTRLEFLPLASPPSSAFSAWDLWPVTLCAHVWEVCVCRGVEVPPILPSFWDPSPDGWGWTCKPASPSMLKSLRCVSGEGTLNQGFLLNMLP